MLHHFFPSFTLMFTFDVFFFLICLPCVGSERFYAFVETLFVIDPNFFPPLSQISYEDYVRTMVDTTNIIFQSQNDLDIKIEMIVSKIVYLQIVQQQSQQPYVYESVLRSSISDYDNYDSIVLLWYQPWEGDYPAQGYAILNGTCHPSNKIMYILPYQNAAFYLAHEFGHQLGLRHQVDTDCYTDAHMSVMTKSHTASFDRARWTGCENRWINSNICNFACLFNRPAHYRPIKRKFATMPGRRMNNDQQAKMIEANKRNWGEVTANSYMPSETSSRCLYFQYYTGESNNANKYILTPMLPGSECGPNAVCYFDQCIPISYLDPSLLQIEYDMEILDLTTHCSAGNDVSTLTASNQDPRNPLECIDWESDFLCEPTRACPRTNDQTVSGLYIKHVCCNKCSSKHVSSIFTFSRARTASSRADLPMIAGFLCIFKMFISCCA